MCYSISFQVSQHRNKIHICWDQAVKRKKKYKLIQWNDALRYPIVTCHIWSSRYYDHFIYHSQINAQFRPVRKFDSNLLTATLFTWPNFHDLAVGDRTCINMYRFQLYLNIVVILLGAVTERVKAVSNYL